MVLIIVHHQFYVADRITEAGDQLFFYLKNVFTRLYNEGWVVVLSMPFL